LYGCFQRQREGSAGNRQSPHKCFFVLRFDLILDGDCTWPSQFDKIVYAVSAWLACEAIRDGFNQPSATVTAARCARTIVAITATVVRALRSFENLTVFGEPPYCGILHSVPAGNAVAAGMVETMSNQPCGSASCAELLTLAT
jgi:hypothetical protein